MFNDKREKDRQEFIQNEISNYNAALAESDRRWRRFLWIVGPLVLILGGGALWLYFSNGGTIDSLIQDFSCLLNRYC